MPQIQSSYDSPNKLRTATSAAPAEGYDLMRALTYDRKGDYEQRRADRGREKPRGTPVQTRPKSIVTEGPQRLSASEQFLRDAQIRAEILRLQAEGAPPPMRMTTFASGANNFYTPDVNAMNAYQRAAYLPREAGMQRGGIGDNMSDLSPGQGPALPSPIDLQTSAERARYAAANNAFYGR